MVRTIMVKNIMALITTLMTQHH